MGTSSARPDDLDSFVGGSRELDGELVGDAAKLRSAYDHFTTSTASGACWTPTSLVHGYKRYPELNETDAAWVANIAGVLPARRRQRRHRDAAGRRDRREPAQRRARATRAQR